MADHILRFHLKRDRSERAATIHVLSETQHKIEYIEAGQVVDESGPHAQLDEAINLAQAFIRETSPDGEKVS